MGTHGGIWNHGVMGLYGAWGHMGGGGGGAWNHGDTWDHGAWGHMGVYMWVHGIMGHMGTYGGIWGHMGTYGGIWGHMEVCGAWDRGAWDHNYGPWGIWGHIEVCGGMGSYGAWDRESMWVYDEQVALLHTCRALKKSMTSLKNRSNSRSTTLSARLYR